MCERDGAEQRKIQPQAGGKSILSAKVVVWLRKKDPERTEGVGSERRRRRYLLPLSSCLSGWRESLDGVILSTMGCSLCTLQKPKEQYKLLYEVCQVL